MRAAAAASRGWRWGLLLAGAAFLLLNLRYSTLLLAPGAPSLPRLYPADAAYAALALGQPPPRRFGLNLLCWSGALAGAEEGVAEFRAAHAAWRDAAALELQGTGMYLYPFEALHVTASNPAPSTHAGHAQWGAEERALYTRAWVGALAARPCAPARAALPLLLRGLRLAPSGAAVLLLDDPTGEVEGLRECMRRAAGALPPRVQAMLGAAGFRAPARGHVHATLARLALPRAEGMGDAEVEERWARAARAWERLVAPRVELLMVRGTALVQGSEVADLASPAFRDFVLWQSSASESSGGGGGGGSAGAAQ